MEIVERMEISLTVSYILGLTSGSVSFTELGCRVIVACNLPGHAKKTKPLWVTSIASTATVLQAVCLASQHCLALHCLVSKSCRIAPSVAKFMHPLTKSQCGGQHHIGITYGHAAYRSRSHGII